MAKRVDSFTDEVRIALVGKYTGLQDSYLSVIKSLKHATIAANLALTIDWIEASRLEKQYEDSEPEAYAAAWAALRNAQGVVVPGGFGDRGVEGKVVARLSKLFPKRL